MAALIIDMVHCEDPRTSMYQMWGPKNFHVSNVSSERLNQSNNKCKSITAANDLISLIANESQQQRTTAQV